MASIASTAIIHPNVILGENVTVEDYCVIGLPFMGMNNDEQTIIGDNSILRAGTYIYAGNRIGKNFHSGNKVNIRELNNIGDDVSVGTLSIIEHHVTIFNNVRIHSQAFIPEYTTLHDEVWVGPNVVITNAKYPKHSDAKNNLQGATVLKNAKIGANCTILPAVEIGENSLIGAGSVVTKNIPSNSVVVGNPANVIKETNY